MSQHKTAKLWIILLSFLMTMLDLSIVFTGTIKMTESLHLTAQTLSWVQIGYALTYARFLLLGGRIGDIYGRKNIFIAGLAIFGLASLLVGLSQNATQIISFRALQGIGGAIVAPTSLALLMETFEAGEERRHAITLYGSVAGIGSVVGLVLGGIFATFASWRDGFLINVPLSLVLLILSMIFLSKSATRNGKLDLIGTVLSVLAMASLDYGVETTAGRPVVLGISLLLWILFIVSQARQHEGNPLMPLTIFRHRERVGAYLVRLLFIAAVLGFGFFTPQILQLQLGFTPFDVALSFLPMSVVQFVIALQVTKLTQHFGNRNVLVTGLIFMLAGIAGLFLLTTHSSYVVGADAQYYIDLKAKKSEAEFLKVLRS